MTRFARSLDYPEELSWLPDWRDASQYPPVEGTSGTRWAWEFLRRNPDYQRDYSSLPEDIKKCLTKVHPGRVSYGGNECHMTIYPLPSREVLAHLERMVTKFHLRKNVYPISPESGQTNLIFGPYTHRRSPSASFVDTSPDKVLIEFDLKLPIEGQIKLARHSLREKGALVGGLKYRPEKFPSYLRILDARTESNPLSFEKIGEIVYPESFEPASTSRKAYNIALLLRNSLFWKIALLVD